ncbi:NAD(P)H-binding protein [Corynebacterium ureicelerivorans]
MTEIRTGLVTGATGYVGGLVVKKLLDDGWRVKILARDADKALGKTWGDEVEIVEGDASERADVAAALEGADCAWYLLHSMGDGAGFAREEAEMARQFGEEAKRAGVERIVYLGGLHPSGEEVSEHLASRVRVGEILMDSGVPTAVLQAGVVIGDGSLSFQLLRHVTERVPAFIAPDWITNEITPIGARDIAFYLVAAADLPAEMNRTFDVGGPDSMPYVEMMQRYAEAVGLHRRPYVTAPIMTRKLAAWGAGRAHPTGLQTDSAHLRIGQRGHGGEGARPRSARGHPGGRQPEVRRRRARGRQKHRPGLVRRNGHSFACCRRGGRRVEWPPVGAGAGQPRRGGGGHHRRGQRAGGRALAVARGCGERARRRRDVGSYFTEKMIISVSSGVPR